MPPWGYWKILHGKNGRQELAKRLVEHAAAIDVHERNGAVNLRDCKPAPPAVELIINMRVLERSVYCTGLEGDG